MKKTINGREKMVFRREALLLYSLSFLLSACGMQSVAESQAVGPDAAIIARSQAETASQSEGADGNDAQNADSEQAVSIETSAAGASGEENTVSPGNAGGTAGTDALSFTEADGEVYVTADDVLVRSAPNTLESSKTSLVAMRGDHFTRTGLSGATAALPGGWTRIRLSTGEERYIATQYVSTEVVEKPTEPETAASGSGTASTASQGSVVEISWNPEWRFAGESLIHTGVARLYYADASIAKGKTVCVNAGHGTQGGGSVKTFCHPDHTPKVTGGSTGAGELKATAVSAGTTMLDGTAEPVVNLQLALLLKDRLLKEGYNVLMIRETADVQLDNIARTVIANQYADCHLALHYDSSTSDKGAFFMSVPEIASYKNMEPVASHWQQHDQLGRCVIQGLRAAGVKIFSNGEMGMDLTQTSYSTVPSIDLELGDRASNWSAAAQDIIASGIVIGINGFFGG